MPTKFRAGTALSDGAYADLVARSVFDCFKWNLTAYDTPLLCRFPILISETAFADLARQAELLAAELLQAEQELLSRPDLFRELAVPKRMAKLFHLGLVSKAPRFLRIDFHPSPTGYRITEANSDVAGGFAEGSGITELWASHVAARSAGNPAVALASALAAQFGEGTTVGLMHLTQYTDDRQVVTYLSKQFEKVGLRTVLFDATQIRAGLRAWSGNEETPLDAVFRFFPGDWLERLPAETAWQELVRSDAVCNPLTTLLTQSKRFPLVWPLLDTDMKTWRALTPETRSPDDVDIQSPDWVLKPAFGHEGSCISITGVSSAKVSATVARQARRTPGRWVAQRRFDFAPLRTPDGLRYACLGIFVINGRAAGAYARVSTTPLIDDTAQDAAILLEAT